MSNTKISSILNKLMSAQKLNVSEVARRAKLPQPTVQRIAAGTCASPHISTLKPLAEFFSVTVDQLKGLEPIPQFDNVGKIPLVEWENAGNIKIDKNHEQIIADVQVSSNAYALKVIDSAMEPFFPRGTLLIVDPSVQPKDRSYVIAKSSGASMPIFRQLIINGPDKLLKPLSPDTEIYKMTKLKKSDAILATVVQARWNYLD